MLVGGNSNTFTRAHSTQIAGPLLITNILDQDYKGIHLTTTLLTVMHCQLRLSGGTPERRLSSSSAIMKERQLQ